MGNVTFKDCERQSKQVWKQFGESKWIPAAKFNASLKHRNVEELHYAGLGKVLVCAAMGASLEDSIESLRKHRSKIDILTCDKGFKPLIEAGIIPDFVHLADTNVLTKWMGGDDSPLWEQTEGVALISTPYGNPEWTKRWKGPIYFYVNKDAIKSEKTFIPIMGDGIRVIPASTNVSNAMVVFMTGADEKQTSNWGGYDKILLTGYDYSWRVGENYYAFDDPKPKRFYMAHRTQLDYVGMPSRTSENLAFSARWMHTYLTQHPALPVVNCSGRGLLDIPKRNDLEKELNGICRDAKKLTALAEAFSIMQMKQKEFKTAKREFIQTREALGNARN